MNNNWKEMTVGQVVAKLPAAAEVFKAVGIDFCCGGHRLLGDVLKEGNVNVAALFGQLDGEWTKLQERAGAEDFTAMPAGDLTEYIEERHHSYLRVALPEAGELLGAVLKAHGRNHSELFEIHGIFGRLRTDLEQHLVKEETLLFPALEEGAGAEDVRALAGQIRAEHEAAGGLLKELRRLTGGYVAPADGCPTFVRLYEVLEALEGDLFQHIHLENNILLLGI